VIEKEVLKVSLKKKEKIQFVDDLNWINFHFF
jgi:hypothetical protein